MYILEVYTTGNSYIYTTHKGFDYLYRLSGLKSPISKNLAPFPPYHNFPPFPSFHLNMTSVPYVVQTEAKHTIFCNHGIAQTHILNRFKLTFCRPPSYIFFQKTLYFECVLQDGAEVKPSPGRETERT